MFRNSFDQFEAYVQVYVPDTLGETVVDSVAIADQLETEPLNLVDRLDFDPFAWALGLNDSTGDWTSESPVLESGVSGFSGGFADATGGSPADRWLSGNEWSGSMSSGTSDPSGEGNHVNSFDGKVIEMPS